MIMIDGAFYAPCGACAQLVLVFTGCPHWRAGLNANAVKMRLGTT